MRVKRLETRKHYDYQLTIYIHSSVILFSLLKFGIGTFKLKHIKRRENFGTRSNFQFICKSVKNGMLSRTKHHSIKVVQQL